MESLGDVLRRAQIPRERIDPVPEPVACPVCHGAGYLRYDVSPGDVRFGELVPCRCTGDELEKRRLARLQEKSNLEGLRELTFDTFIRKYRDGRPPPRSADHGWEVARQYAESPRGWLVLFGPFGVGKTHLAAAIANHRISLGEPAVFIVVPDLLDHLRATFNPNSEITYDELFETVRNTPLLVLDDLGAHTSTQWAQEKLYQVLNHRHNHALWTVVTTNQNLDEIEPRLRSRLGDNHLSQLCEIKDLDKRLGITHASVTGASPGFQPRTGRGRGEGRP